MKTADKILPEESQKAALTSSAEGLQSVEAFYDELRALEADFTATKPELEVSVADAKTAMQGHVVVWNTFSNPEYPLGRVGKGGTRITPELTLDEVRMLARIMALKNAAAGLPLGGAKSGLRADPDAEGFEATYRSFVRAVKPVLRENGGIFGGFGFDIGARPEHPLWACDELGSLSSFTGKPVEMGGTDYDKEGIAGLGVAVAARIVLDELGQQAAEASFAVQGLGAMGAAVYRYFSEMGGQPLFISDPRLGGTYRLTEKVSRELAASIASQDFSASKTILDKSGCVPMALEDILYQRVHILFPCAVQDVVTAANAARVQASYLIEGANNPCSSEARTLLFGKGITVMPDFIANPGGIIAAYVELASDVTPEENAKTRRKVLEAKRMTEEKIEVNVRDVMRMVKTLGVEPVHAGKLLALRRILS